MRESLNAGRGKREQRGSVLAHVLVTSVVVSLIAAGLLRMVLMDHMANERLAVGDRGKKSAETALNQVMGVWNKANIVCSDASAVGYSCDPLSVSTPGACSCICIKAGAPTIAVTGAPPCTVTITTP